MKRAVMLLALITAAALAAAQTGGTQPPQQKPPAQSGTTQATPGQQPATGAQPQAAPAQAAPLPGTKRPPQAKNQEEFKAFQEANAKTTPAESEAAANDFAQKFADSELRILLYRKALYDYQNANNADKAIEMGRKMIALDPNNPEALVMTATFLSERTRDTDLDRDERLSEATRDAQKAIETVDTDLMLPGNMTAEQATGIKNQMKGMAYAALGTSSIAKKDYPAAETNLKQASQLYPGDPLVWLRLAYALDQQKKYGEALPPTNNCLQYATDQPQVANLCKAEKERLTKLTQSPPPAAAPAPTSPQPQTSVPK
jgi:tetratricopeptide (TPR) repeat protein